MKPASGLPFASIRFETGELGVDRCVVVIGGKDIAEFPVSSVSYEQDCHVLGRWSITIPADRDAPLAGTLVLD